MPPVECMLIVRVTPGLSAFPLGSVSPFWKDKVPVSGTPIGTAKPDVRLVAVIAVPHPVSVVGTPLSVTESMLVAVAPVLMNAARMRN